MSRTPFNISDLKPHRSIRVLKAAEELILESGYAGISLDTVVERAGCSKSTVYEFFGSKEGLIIALLENLIGEFQQQIENAADTGKPISDGLRDYARLTLKRVLSERHIALIRAILNESSGSPEIAKTYYEMGPRAALQQVSDYLDNRMPESGLDIVDTREAADTFYSMIFSRVYARLFGAEMPLSDSEIDSEASRIVDLFMKMYS
jgi:AcrR family transcriptional regulator